MAESGEPRVESGVNPTRETAVRITDDLFTNAFGQRADRLVLTTTHDKSIGGWCYQAVLDRIEAHLRQGTTEQ